MNTLEIRNKGIELAKTYNIAICSVVRNCNLNLARNILVMEKLRRYFNSSIVIVFENDSIDGTKQTLKEWNKDSSNIYIESVNLGSKTIPDSNSNGVIRFFSSSRISKMADYRNKYMDKLNKIDFNPDFVLVVDLDISKISINGILHSFGLVHQWDVICANGYSISPRFKRRYHDTYALVEFGNENIPQTEESIVGTATKWNFLKKGLPLIPVYSAFGGISLYRYEAIKNLNKLSYNEGS